MTNEDWSRCLEADHPDSWDERSAPVPEEHLP